MFVGGAQAFYIDSFHEGDIVTAKLFASDILKGPFIRKVYRITDIIDLETVEAEDIVTKRRIEFNTGDLLQATPTEIVEYKQNGKNS